MAVIQGELEKGVKVTDEIMVGKRPWRDLFTKHTFFTTGFRFYLTVISSSKTKEAQNKWASFIESRVRHLVMKLDMHASIRLARPFNKGYDRVHRCQTDTQIEQVQAGSLAYLVKAEDLEKADIKAEVQSDPVKTERTEANGVKGEENGDVKLEDIPEKPENDTPPEIEIYTTNHYIGLQLNEGAKSLDLSREVNEFKAFCMSNDKIFDEKLMCLTVQQVRNFDLPDDVFEPGEVKPVRPIKKKRPATEESAKADAKRQRTATAAG
jgi:poly(A) polymerase